MVILFNNTLDIGSILQASTTTVTGSDTLTYLLLFVLIILIALLFRAPMILVMLLSIPLIIILSIGEGFGSIFYTILSIIGLVIAWQFAKIIFGWGR